jgi:hypothetical protein
MACSHCQQEIAVDYPITVIWGKDLNLFCDINCRSIWFSLSPDVSRITCCDRGYARPSGRPRVSDPATYCSSAPRIQPPAVARWHTVLHGLATAIRETSGLVLQPQKGKLTI